MLQNVTGLWEKVDTDVYRWVRQLSTLKRRLPGGDATDSQAPANRARKAPAPSRDAPPDGRPAAQDAASPGGRAAAPLGDATGSPDGKAQEACLAEEAVRTQPSGMTGHLPALGETRSFTPSNRGDSWGVML